jgi:DNA end-binding protein Ku
MRFADELVGRSDLDVPRAAKKPDEREIKMAAQLIESLHEKFKPEKYEDDYRQTVLDAIRKKAEGQDIEPPEEPEPEEHDDLLAALEASLGGKR